jgi:hypothetical protein
MLGGLVKMRIGDRVLLTNGYDMEPQWLAGGTGYHGTIEKFIPGQSDRPAAVVRFEQPVVVGGLAGNYAVLELRHVGATWGGSEETVHVELCDFVPDDIRWKDRRKGKWVESHATVMVDTQSETV